MHKIWMVEMFYGLVLNVASHLIFSDVDGDGLFDEDCMEIGECVLFEPRYG